MIFTEILEPSAAPDSDDGIETAYISSNDLGKKILRVVTANGRACGINISHSRCALYDGVILTDDSGTLLQLRTIAEKVIVIIPSDMDRMGIIAHMLGNSHKPISVANGRIILHYDPVVESILKRDGVDYSVEELSLKKALRHVSLAR